MNPQRILRQKLEDLQRAGVTQLPRELTDLVAELSQQTTAAPKSVENPAKAVVPAKPMVATPQPASSVKTASAETPVQSSTSKSQKSPQPTSTAAPVTRQFLPSSSGSMPREFSADTARPLSPLSLDERVASLRKAAEQVAACVRCQELAETRTQTVFGVGNPEADIIYIGEAPGADEDRQGEPFVGRAGQLLDKITEACKLTREEIYICNILRCRPPGNRNPTPDEAANCREYLDAQIEAVDPKYIVCWGSVAAHNLLGTKAAIGKMRGKFFDYKGIKVLCTYHPSYLLRSPGAKKDVWADMKIFRADMGVILD